MRPLHTKIIEHVLALLLVGLVVGIALLWIGSRNTTTPVPSNDISRFLSVDSLDLGSPLHRAFLRDALRLFHGRNEAVVDSLMYALEQARLAQFADAERKLGGGRRRLTWEMFGSLIPMYAVFVSVYLSVLLLTTLAARTIAIYRFTMMKQGRSSYLRSYIAAIEHRGITAAIGRLDLLVKAAMRGVAYVVLFAPAYVIAYAFRTRIETDNALFLVILGVCSNGLLINYANKFYSMLVTESRRGYMETALVKGLASSYEWGTADGLTHGVLYRPLRSSQGHVFRHMYLNASFQFFPTIKEHAAFLVTGLVIIEMALNITGYLSYTLLQHILYREFDIALVIVFGIFVAVKMTELVVDIIHGLRQEKYGNR